MDNSLWVSSLIAHAARHFGDVKIVSQRIDGPPMHVSCHAAAARRHATESPIGGKIAGLLVRPRDAMITASRCNAGSIVGSAAKELDVLKHIVMWKLKERAEGADRATNAIRLKAMLEGCRNIVPGIRRFEVGVATPGLEATYDVVLVSEFDDKAALEAYAVHPEHEKIKAFVASVRDARQCIDYEA